nr:probable inactive receptor kinase At3g02880 [Ipomoea batatas]
MSPEIGGGPANKQTEIEIPPEKPAGKPRRRTGGVGAREKENRKADAIAGGNGSTWPQAEVLGKGTFSELHTKLFLKWVNNGGEEAKEIAYYLAETKSFLVYDYIRNWESLSALLHEFRVLFISSVPFGGRMVICLFAISVFDCARAVSVFWGSVYIGLLGEYLYPPNWILLISPFLLSNRKHDCYSFGRVAPRAILLTGKAPTHSLLTDGTREVALICHDGCSPIVPGNRSGSAEVVWISSFLRYQNESRRDMVQPPAARG